MVRRDPRLYDIEHTRWTLEFILSVCDWLHISTLSGIHRLLDRVSISLKRGKQYFHSPDPNYEDKLSLIHKRLDETRKSDGSLVFLYMDECTYFQHPTVGYAYEQVGRHYPLARLGYASNGRTSIVGALNPLDGRVSYHQCESVGVDALVSFYRQLCDTYPDAVRIYVAQDNGPIHFHPEVLHALEPQESNWPRHLPPSWIKAEAKRSKKRVDSHPKLPIQILPLPTYASWTNPIEKLWRKLRQELLHMHPYGDDLDRLRSMVERFLDRLAYGSTDLLRYVGLQTPD